MTTQQRRRYDIFLKETSAKIPVVLGSDGRTTTLRLFKARPVHVAEVPADVGFDPDGDLLLPVAPSGIGSPLAVLAEVLRFLGDHPDKQLLVAAHGPDAARTQARARSALAVLAGDAEVFAAAGAGASVHDWQRVLAWAAAAFGWPCDPGAVDGKAGPKTYGALRAFRAAAGASAGPDAVRPDDWRAFLACYDRELARLLGPSHDLAAVRGALQLVPAGAAGCAGEWPISRCRIEGLPSQADARVDLLVFAPEDAPRLECHADDAFAPKRCDVYRKGKYRAEPIVARAQPAIVRGLLTGMFFDTDKAFLLPRAMAGIRRLKRYYELHAGQQMLVVGHTDTTGRPDYNLPLSDERAAAVAAYLRDDVEPWLAWYEAAKESKRWGTREDQHMLSALPPGGPAFFVGEVDGKADAETKAALEAFQAWSNDARGTSLKVDGIAGPKTRRELIGAYMDLDGATLPEGTVLLTHGCGEHHPDVATGDGVAAQENRRVEVFFFPDGVAPPPRATCPAPGCPEYPVWRQLTVLTIDLSLEPGLLEVLVTDAEEKHVLADADVDLMGVDPRQGKTDGAGRVRFDELFPGPYELTAKRGGYQSAVAGVVVAPGAAKAKTGPAKDDPIVTKAAFVDAGPAEAADTPAGDAAAADPLHVPLKPIPATITALRGADPKPLAVGGDPYAKVKLSPTKVASALHQQDARDLELGEQVPAPVDLTVLRVQPGAKTDRTLTLEVHKRDKVEKVTLKNDDVKLEQGRFDVRLQLVFGAPAQGAPAATLAGVRTVDVSDPHPDGTEDYARKVVVVGLGLPPLPLDVELRRPRIVRFVGVAVPPEQGRYERASAPRPKESAAASRVIVHQDWTLRLEWKVLGPFQRLTLEPLGQAVEAAGKEPAAGSLALDPARRPPLPSGAYTLVARGADDAAPQASAVVKAVGITRFALRSASSHRLEETHITKPMDPKTGFPRTSPVEVLLGRAGTFHPSLPAKPGLMHLGAPDKEGTFWFGQIVGTKSPPVRLEWSVVGADDVEVTLDVRRQVDADKKPLPPYDVTETTRKTGGHELEHETRFSSSTITYLEADLNVWDRGAKREPGNRLTCSVVRLRIDRAFPFIADGDAGFGAYDQSHRLADGEAVSSWENLHFVWGLTGDHKFNRLRLSLVEKGKGEDDDHPPALLELDLKPRGEVYSSGDVAVPVPMPKGLQGKSDLVAVADLVREPLPHEKAKGETRPWVHTWNKALPIARRKVRLRLPVEQPKGTFPCVDLHEACPVNRALELRQKYLDSLQKLAEVREKYGQSLRAAYFTKAVAEKVVDPTFLSKLTPGEVWGALRGPTGSDDPAATKYEDSWLKREIDRMEGETQAALDATEKAAGALIAFITSKTKLYMGKSFQEHLIADAHVKHVINEGKDNAALAERLYGVGAPASYDPAQKVYRHIDHVCALLTDYLYMTHVGRKFLEETTDQAKLKTDYLAFDYVWDFVGKINNVTEPVGKIIYNVSLAHHHSVRMWTKFQVNDFIQKKLLPSDKLRQFIDFLNVRLGKTIDVEKVLYEKALDLTDKTKALREHLRTSPVTLDSVEKYSKTTKGEAAKTIGLWFNLTIDAIALAIALQKASHDWKGEAKSWISVAKELFGTLKSAGEVARGQLLSKGAHLTEGSAELRLLTTRAANVEAVVFKAGAVAGILGAVISAMDAIEGFESKDWDRVLLHSAAAVASLVAIWLPGVGALLALAIAITMFFVFDHPVVDWLEDTPWGEDQVFKIEEVIDKFYESMYDVYLYGKELVSHDSNHDAVVVESGLLGPDVLVFLTISVGGTSLTKQVTLTDPKKPSGGALTIDGKALVQWPSQNVEGKPRFLVFRAWEAFSNVQRADVDHDVEVAIYPDKDTKPLKIKKSVTFRRPPAPRLDEISGHYWGLPGERQKHVGLVASGEEYFQVDPGQELTEVSFRTQFADGCKVKVELYKTDWAIWKGDLVSDQTVTIVDKTAGTGKSSSVVTKVKLKFDLPPADDDYTGQLWLTLFDPSGKELEDRVSGKFKVARSAFIAAQ